MASKMLSYVLGQYPTLPILWIGGSNAQLTHTSNHVGALGKIFIGR
jgi:hypothetical protein